MFEAFSKALRKFADGVASATGAGITIREEHIDEALDDLELSLLQADVALEVVERLREILKEKLVGRKVSGKKDIVKVIRDALVELLNVPAPSITPPGEKPYIILFVGPNGVGKTTTIAKIAYLLKKKGYSSVISASDTFRAGSIEQTEEWARKVGVRVVKHDYGADPAAVAFDAVKSAKARGDDYVLIDTAGRQETNENLMEQLKKIKRVVRPHLTVFVGEAITGNALLEQIRRFDEELGVDAVVLTKLDTDARGGSAFTATVGAGKPIIFVGLGESPDDLKPFDPEEIVEAIFGQD